MSNVWFLITKQSDCLTLLLKSNLVTNISHFIWVKGRYHGYLIITTMS